MENLIHPSDVRPLRSSISVTRLPHLFDRFRSFCLWLMSRLLNSKDLRCVVLRECTEEIHYKGKAIETTVFSDGLWSWHAHHTVWPTLERIGEGHSITTVGLTAYNELDALTLAIAEIQDMIDSKFLYQHIYQSPDSS